MNDYSAQIERLRSALDAADAVVIGAGAGLSTSAGFTYSGERFERYFSDFAEKYGIQDMYSGGFYPFPTPEVFWAYWSRYIFINRYQDAPKLVYDELLALVRDKDYFVITTNERVKHPYAWAKTTVHQILSNPIYLGKLVSQRYKTKSFKDKRIVPRPEDEWITVKISIICPYYHRREYQATAFFAVVRGLYPETCGYIISLLSQTAYAIIITSS